MSVSYGVLDKKHQIFVDFLQEFKIEFSTIFEYAN